MQWHRRAASIVAWMALAGSLSASGSARAQNDVEKTSTSTNLNAEALENLPRGNSLAAIGALAVPVGPYNDVARTGGGLGVRLAHPIGGRASLVFGAGLDLFGSKVESTFGEYGTIASEYAFTGLDIEVLRSPGGARYGDNPRAGSLLIGVGSTNFDATFDYSTVDAESHFSQNSLAIIAAATYLQPVSEYYRLLLTVGGNHAFSPNGDSRIFAGVGVSTMLWRGSDARAMTGTAGEAGGLLFGGGFSCNYPHFGNFSEEVAHGFGVGARIVKPVALPLNIAAFENMNLPTNGAIYADFNYGFLRPALDVALNDIDTRTSSYAISAGLQYDLWATTRAETYIMGSIGYESVTNERESTVPQLPAYDHSESGFAVRGGCGVRLPIAPSLRLDFWMDTPLIGIGFDEHTTEPGDAPWADYKPHQTRMTAALLFDMGKF